MFRGVTPLAWHDGLIPNSRHSKRQGGLFFQQPPLLFSGAEEGIQKLNITY